jgi:hypothetical protein
VKEGDPAGFTTPFSSDCHIAAGFRGVRRRPEYLLLVILKDLYPVMDIRCSIQPETISSIPEQIVAEIQERAALTR